MYFQKRIVHQTEHKKLEPYHPNAPRNRPKETVETLSHRHVLWEHVGMAIDPNTVCSRSCRMWWATGISCIPASSEHWLSAMCVPHWSCTQT